MASKGQVVKSIKATPAHEKCMRDLKAALKANVNLSGVEMLAVTSQLVGQIIAAQDQRTVTPDMAMQVIIENIKAGNQLVLASLFKTEGNA